MVLRVAVCAMVAALLHHCCALPDPGNYLANAPRHVPRIGRRSQGDQTAGDAASKSLYYQLPRHLPRVGRRDPSVPLYPGRQRNDGNTGGREDEDLLTLWRRATILENGGDRYDETAREAGDTSMDDTSQYGGTQEREGRDDAEDIDGELFKDIDALDTVGSPTGNYRIADQPEHFARGTRYDGYFFRSARDQNPYFRSYRSDSSHGGGHYGRKAPGSVLESSGLVDSGQSHVRDPRKCIGRHCPGSSEMLEYMMKDLLKEIIARREEAADSYRLAAENPPKRSWEPRQLW